MNAPIHLVLMLLAIICLVLAAFGVTTPKGSLLAAGLALWALAVTIG